MMQYENSKAIENVTFDIEKGSFVSIVGENGAGKSTLVKGIVGIEPVFAGTIDINSNKKVFGYMPQHTSVSNHFPASVYEICKTGCLAGKLIPHLSKTDFEKINLYISLLGLENIKNKKFSSLSGGQKQKALLCRALCTQSEILVLDEPSNGLDISSAYDLYEALKDINLRLGVTCIIISHDMDAAVKYSSHILHLNKYMLFYGNTNDYITSDVYLHYKGGVKKTDA